MTTLKFTPNFSRAYKAFTKGDDRKAKRTKKALKLFGMSPTHPSLNLEKLGGSNIWSIRIDQGNRLFFRWIDKQTAIFVDIGPHDKYRKY